MLSISHELVPASECTGADYYFGLCIKIFYILQFQVNSGLLISDISDHLPVFAICGNQVACMCLIPFK